MKMKKLFFIIFATICYSITSFGQDITIGKRDTVSSTILNQDRAFSVYLPPSYNETINQKYPVLYILDGDYNFRYVAGLLELQGGISELIPETILIAISGKGTATYRNNCKPNIEGIEDKGNAEEVAQFIEKELIPYVNANYKTAHYKILAGHSVGGLFVINTALNHPDLFNHYIAISPALWWGKNAINQVAEKRLSDDKNFKSSVYISLANEKGMGVDAFLKLVPSSLKKEVFKYKEFPDENHNSVGLPTYQWALGEIYKDWRVEKEYFSSAEELNKHYNRVMQIYGSIFNIPFTNIVYTHYILKDKPKELLKVQEAFKAHNPNAFVAFKNYSAGKLIDEQKFEEAALLLNDAKVVNPNSFELYHTLAKMEWKQNNVNKALSMIGHAIELAQSQHARQWQINELDETKFLIKQSQ
ncbi:MAG: hypothetical protein DHS20C18_45690 [Saprospiraceae bacterium]|nr:MAG: hypothetical protein DHS20C18_45690 [Saprospiraceae bacterium]